MLKVSLRENFYTGAKRAYVFRSTNTGELTVDQLVTEMATFNTTITEADTLGVLNVMKRIVLKYVNLGYTVHTPLGYFHASASGSTDDLLDSFNPNDSAKNHELALLYCPNTEVSKNVNDSIQIERASNRPVMTPSIDKVQNADGTGTTEIRPNDLIVILGDYLKFDPAKTEQGVFLSKDGTETRLTYYAHNTQGKIEARIPADLAAGSYTVMIRNVPSTKPMEVTYKKAVAITA
jgi:hypothetical protein